jgi:L-histidine N-alpha-methyltransferase
MAVDVSSKTAAKTITDINASGFVPNENLQFVQDVLFGLSGTEKSLPSKYFYDEEGSKIFQQIMELEEYYLTRSETNILGNRKDELLRLLANHTFSLIDLGSGDGTKTKILLRHFEENEAKFTYFPVDISASILQTQLKTLSEELPGVQTNAIVAEYYDALSWLKMQPTGQKLVLLLGSNIGNFSYAETLKFLQTLWHLLDDKDLLLIGFDLKKSPDDIIRAYDDSKGVTARFNYNLLHRINQELDADFKIENFRHHATYDPVSGACKSFLLSLKEQAVTINKLNKTFFFEAWEPIHTEYSYKYSLNDIGRLAEETGFSVVRNLTDNEHTFVDSVWKVIK